MKENALFSWRYKRAKPQADTWKRRGKRGRGRRHSGDEKRKKSVREKRNALSVFSHLFPPFSFSPDRYLSGGKSVRKTVRGYEKWKLDAGKSPVDVNANRLRKGGWKSIEMCYSIGAHARLGRERVLTGTTRRAFSPRRVIARRRQRGILGILLRNASRIQRSTRKRRDKLSAKFAEKYLHVRITWKDLSRG